MAKSLNVQNPVIGASRMLVRRALGPVIDRNSRHREAPSTRAASYDLSARSTVFSVSGNNTGGVHDHYLPIGTAGRYVRMQGVTRGSTSHGYTLVEFEVSYR